MSSSPPRIPVLLSVLLSALVTRSTATEQVSSFSSQVSSVSSFAELNASIALAPDGVDQTFILPSEGFDWPAQLVIPPSKVVRLVGRKSEASDNKRVTIDAKKRSRHLFVTKGATLAVQGLDFRNGVALQTTDAPGGVMWGGSILNHGVIEYARDCGFLANKAFSYAGAIFNAGRIDILEHSSFEGNSAYFGGAFTQVSGSADLVNCTFTGNFALRAGALLLSGGFLPRIEDCTFSKNQAQKTAAGAIQVDLLPQGNPSTRNLDMSWSQGWSLLVSNSTFTENEAATQNKNGAPSTAAPSGGGAILFTTRGDAPGATLVISGSRFSGNVHHNRNSLGGAVYTDGQLIISNSRLNDGLPNEAVTGPNVYVDATGLLRIGSDCDLQSAADPGVAAHPIGRIFKGCPSGTSLRDVSSVTLRDILNNASHPCKAFWEVPANAGKSCPESVRPFEWNGPSAQFDAPGFNFPHASTCESCNQGKFSVGAQTKCDFCLPGRDSAGKTGQSECTDCLQGRARLNGETCEPCAAGQFQPNSGKVVCLPQFCPAGKHESTNSTPTVFTCMDCPKGRYSSVRGLKSANECSECPSGKFGTSAGEVAVTTACEICPAGKENLIRGAANASACKVCQPGQYSTHGIACSPCAPGRFGNQPQTTSSNCSGECGAGWYCPAGTAQPVPCGPFTFYPRFVTRNASCLACPPRARCAGAGSVVNRPGWWPLFDDNNDLITCATEDASNCFQACLSPEACPGALTMNADESRRRLMNASELMRSPNEWLSYYTMSTSDRWQQRSCNKGYEGLLCGNCSHANASWHFVRSSSACRRCPSPGVSWLVTVFALLAFAAVAFFLVHRTVNRNSSAKVNDDNDDDDDDDAEHGDATQQDRVGRKDDPLIPILRQLISYIMLLGKIGSFQVGAVKAFRTAVHAVSEVTTGVGLGSYWFTCAVGWNFYQRLLVVALMPALVIVVCFFVVRLAFCRQPWRQFIRATLLRHAHGSRNSMGNDGDALTDDGDSHHNQVADAGAVADGVTPSSADTILLNQRVRCYFDASVVYLFYLAFPTVTHQVLEALSCTEIAFVSTERSRERFLTADFRISCDDPAYSTGARSVAIVLVLTYIVSPPVLLGLWIRRNRGHLQDPMAMRRLGFLYRGFRLDAYPWWACVQLGTKAAIVSIVVFFDKELEQMVTALLLFTVLLMLQISLRPFATPVLNRLQVFTLLSLTITQFVPVAVSTFETANQQDRQQVIDSEAAVTISVFLLIINGAVAMMYLVEAWRHRGALPKMLGRVCRSVGRVRAIGQACCRRTRAASRRESEMDLLALSASETISNISTTAISEHPYVALPEDGLDHHRR